MRKKIIFLALVMPIFFTSQAQQKTVEPGYIDLGLPSGTIWKKTNATGFYTYDQAVSEFGNRLPSKEQWEELKDECDWTWTGNGYKVTGPNGNSITLPAAGRPYGTDVSGVGTYGYYWSSTYDKEDWSFYMFIQDVFISAGNTNHRNVTYSVRLVQN